MQDYSQLTEVVSAFQIEGDILEIRPLGSGLINDTYLALTSKRKYVLQRINDSIFKDVDLLQKNITAVTSHIRYKLQERGVEDIDRKVLTFLPIRSELESPSEQPPKTYLQDSKGSYWRLSLYIEDSYTYLTVNPEYSKVAGRSFGEFESMLVDLKEPLGETIPDFHNMSLRIKQLREAVAADPQGRYRRAQSQSEPSAEQGGGLVELVELAEKNAERMCSAQLWHEQGRLPKRICHCDTKVNNMLFDRDGKVLCVIDLDTVMPSFVFSDYGDFLRTAANPVPEDSPEYDKVDFRMDIFEAFTEGYLSGAGSFLTDMEIENLPFAAELFPFMQAVRFLCDYLNGDTYYKISYPEHNLVRARNQFRLFQSACSKEERMRKFIAKART
ncbi:MAG: phosphotransferase enzyme family protein [Candidatus Cryptobacteroides sp.]